MKNLFLFSIIIFSLLSCDSDETVMSGEIIGTWLLTEVLADPGDGSGVFTPVDSEKKLTFTADGKMSSNGNFCNAPVINGSGVFSLSDNTITVECSQTINLHFDLTPESLTIYKPCIEACAEKYVRI